LVVRTSNKYVTVQVIAAEIIGDRVLTQANSRELQRWDERLTMGLKNYAACYATGLLAARRLLTKVGLADVYKGNEEPNGEVVSHTAENGRTYFVDALDEESGKKPFRCLLDVGVKNTTTGARIFGALKGASDGGLDIPHSNKRFPGYNRDTKVYEAEVHKAHIFGEHVADYMREMEEDDEENYKKHFAGYRSHDLSADDLEELYEKLHEAIREDPVASEKSSFSAIDKSFKKGVKKTYAARKADSNAKKALLQGGGEAADEEDDE